MFHLWCPFVGQNTHEFPFVYFWKCKSDSLSYSIKIMKMPNNYRLKQNWLITLGVLLQNTVCLIWHFFWHYLFIIFQPGGKSTVLLCYMLFSLQRACWIGLRISGIFSLCLSRLSWDYICKLWSGNYWELLEFIPGIRILRPWCAQNYQALFKVYVVDLNDIFSCDIHCFKLKANKLTDFPYFYIMCDIKISNIYCIKLLQSLISKTFWTHTFFPLHTRYYVRITSNNNNINHI